MSGRRYPGSREAGGPDGGTDQTPAPPTPAPPAPPLSNVPGTGQPLDPSQVRAGSAIFGRRWKLAVSPPQAGSTGYDLSALHLTFNVTDVQWATPKKLEALVYNVSDALIDTITKPSNNLSHITLEAGYNSPQSRYGMIFDGNVFYYQRRRLNPTDTALHIVAYGFDPIFTEALINTTLPAGSTEADRIKACQQTFEKFGVNGTTLPSDLSAQQSPRGRTMAGATQDVLRDITNTNQLTCTVDDKKLAMLRAGALNDPNSFVLNSASGMIGTPQQEYGGAIAVRSLLNPLIKPMSGIQIKEEDIARLSQPNPQNQGIVGPRSLPEDQFKLDLTARIRADGFYRAFSVTHQGDSRGAMWFTDIKTQKLDPTQSGPSIGGTH